MSPSSSVLCSKTPGGPGVQYAVTQAPVSSSDRDQRLTVCGLCRLWGVFGLHMYTYCRLGLGFWPLISVTLSAKLNVHVIALHSRVGTIAINLSGRVWGGSRHNLTLKVQCDNILKSGHAWSCLIPVVRFFRWSTLSILELSPMEHWCLADFCYYLSGLSHIEVDLVVRKSDGHMTIPSGNRVFRGPSATSRGSLSALNLSCRSKGLSTIPRHPQV